MTDAALLAAIEATLTANPGVLQVQVDGVTVRYESLSAMLEARRQLVRDIARAAGTRPVVAQADLRGAW